MVLPNTLYQLDNSGAESDIKHYDTLPGVPDKPENLDLISNSTSDQIRIKWTAGLNPNGPPNGTFFRLWIGEERSNNCLTLLPERNVDPSEDKPERMKGLSTFTRNFIKFSQILLIIFILTFSNSS